LYGGRFSANFGGDDRANHRQNTTIRRNP
jgi:hypothetical protein